MSDQTTQDTSSPEAPSVPGLLRSIAHRLAGDQLALPVEGRLASIEGAPGGQGIPGPILERRFEIEFLDAGAEAYCFTFG